MARRFFDLDMQSARSAGADSIQAMAERAERLGFDAIAVADYVTAPDDPAQFAVPDVDADIAVRTGAMLKPESAGDLKELVRGVREEVDVLAVHGGDAAVNRAATGDTRVDVLAHPELNRTDSGLDHVMVQQAADNRVAVQVSLRRLLETRGKVRAHILSHLRRNVRLCQHVGAPVIASSGAQSVHQLRAPRELAAFPRILGMDLEEAFATVSDVPRAILDRADRVNDDATVRPGVTVEREGGGDGG